VTAQHEPLGGVMRRLAELEIETVGPTGLLGLPDMLRKRDNNYHVVRACQNMMQCSGCAQVAPTYYFIGLPLLDIVDAIREQCAGSE
jgi:hypothetical protein